MMRAMLLGLGIVTALASGDRAGAQTAPDRPAVSDPARAIAGVFELSDADARRRCAMTLEAKPQGPGYSLMFDKAPCSAAFPFIANVIAWTTGGGGAIRLLDATGRVIAEFGETEEGLYETVRAGDGVYFLSNHAAPEAASLNVADVVGTWALARQAGRTICRITFGDQPAGDGLRVTLSANCDAGVAAFQPIFWRPERADIILVSARGDMMRFEKGDGAVWRKVPEAGRPLVMTR